MCSNSKDSYFFCVFLGSAFNAQINLDWGEPLFSSSGCVVGWPWGPDGCFDQSKLCGRICVGTSLIFRETCGWISLDVLNMLKNELDWQSMHVLWDKRVPLERPKTLVKGQPGSSPNILSKHCPGWDIWAECIFGDQRRLRRWQHLYWSLWRNLFTTRCAECCLERWLSQWSIIRNCESVLISLGPPSRFSLGSQANLWLVVFFGDGFIKFHPIYSRQRPFLVYGIIPPLKRWWEEDCNVVVWNGWNMTPW